ncbi:MAG TPA: arylsulfatase, partial [Pyrinomonadaceae bacterium]|nr:arylsulfatase [Pyrinomonadaceae bacterium]
HAEFSRQFMWVMTVNLILFGFLVFATPDAFAKRKPNIIFILADDLGYGDLGSYGQKKIKTPHLDRMAAGGIRFTQFYSGSTVCAPSRAALMTGLHTGHAYIRGNGDIPLRPNDLTVAEILKSSGYRTAVIGKWGLGTEETTGRPDRKGFDESFGFLHHRHAHRQYTDHLWKNAVKFPVDAGRDFVNDLFTEASLDFIARNKSRPFFLYLAYTNPHAEIRVPEDSLAEYKGKFPETPFVNLKADRHPSQGYRSHPTPHAAFAGMVTRMDRDVGRILDHLKQLGLDKETIVFFTSDNGPHKEGGADPEFFDSNGPLRGIKRDLYDGGIRVPMIVRWPGTIKSGRTSEQVWAMWDFFPTAAAIAGARAPKDVDGISMLPALKGKRQRSHDYLYWEFFERGFQQAIRMNNWKAVRLAPGQPLELYDLSKDVSETENVADRHPKVVAEMEKILAGARTESEKWPARVAETVKPRENFGR